MLFVKNFSINFSILLIAIINLQSCTSIEDPPHVLLREAHNLEFSGKPKEAEIAFTKILSLSNIQTTPLHLAVLMNMSRFYLRAKNYLEAINICDKALKVCDQVYGQNDELKLSILFIKASAYEGQGEYDKAQLIYNQLLASTLKDETNKIKTMLPLVKLGDMAFKRSDFKQAFKLYYRASKITLLPNPLFRILNYRLGITSIAMGRTSGAEAYLKESLPVGPRVAGPGELFDDYADLLKKNYKYGTARYILAEGVDWKLRRGEYLNWLSTRVASPTQFDFLDKCTEKDFLNWK